MNYLIDQQGHLRISDFGLSIPQSKTVSSLSQVSVGSLAWMAPELLTLGTTDPEKCDIFAFGVVLWEIASRQIPYEEFTEFQVRENVKEGERLLIPLDVPVGFYNLITQCWDQDPAKRPKAETIVNKLRELSALPVQAGLVLQKYERKAEKEIHDEKGLTPSTDDLKTRLNAVETNLRLLANDPLLDEALALLPKNPELSQLLQILETSRQLIKHH